jgi:hypothetical protein
MVATVELLLELAGEPGDGAAEDGNLVDQLVLDPGELLLAARLRRKAARELLLVGREDVDAVAARVADRVERVRAAIESDQYEQRLERERRERIRRGAPRAGLAAARDHRDAGRPVGHEPSQLARIDRRAHGAIVAQRASATLGAWRSEASTSS